MSSQVIGTTEQSGFSGVIRKSDETGKEFVVWTLAQFRCDRGKPVQVTAVTARNGHLRAAAYNLQYGKMDFLARIMKSRHVLSRDGKYVNVSVPGAQVHGVGYDEPMKLTLSATVGSISDATLADQAMAKTVAEIVARGVYALVPKEGQAAGDDASERADDAAVDSIQF